MPNFIYRAKRGPEDFVEGQIVANNRDEVVGKLEALGLIPIRIEDQEELKKRTSEEDHKVRFGRVRSKDIDAFTWQLASLVKSNVPMLKALSLISQQTENAYFKKIIKEFEHEVKNGKMLSESMKKYPKFFNTLFVNMIKSGEEGGVLDEVLYKLAQYREKEQSLKRKVQSAMAYPTIMIVVGIATVFIMLTFFMPKLIHIFETMKQTLPLPTRILINASHFMQENWYWFLMAFVLIGAVLARVSRNAQKKTVLDILKLHIPVVKSFVRNAEISKFCRSLALLLKNGMSVYDALDLSTNTIENNALREPLKGVSQEIVNKGSSLSASLRKTGIFPNFVINMIAVGEESGRLEESLNEVAVSYEREVEQGINIMTSLIEPLLILFIGGIVGFIVFAMLLPIFDMGMGGM